MRVETFELAPGYGISRLLRGGWQLAGGHGPVDRERAVADMSAFVDAGIATFDCADIYTGVEELIGHFRARLLAERGRAALAGLKVHTKFVPDWDDLATLDRAYVVRIIDRSLLRLKAERLDLVQFHWWNYEEPRHVETALILDELRRAGKIDRIGGTNFDAPHTAAMLEAGVPVVSMQTQYSLIDRRPEAALAPLCARTGMKLICYGALAGGFFTERWLGAPEPGDLSFNRSLLKYKLVIDDAGGWDLFQALLRTLAQVASRHGVTIAQIAVRWVLDQPQVAGAIVGARYADHLPANLKVFDFRFDPVDEAEITALVGHLKPLQGDAYGLERDSKGRHGGIMKYNLNKA